LKKLVLVLVLSVLAVPVTSQQAVPEIAFDAPVDYFQYDPDKMSLGEITAVASNSKGHVFLLSRSNPSGNVYGSAATQVFEFNERGQFVREIGKGVWGFAFGHGIRVDKYDNLWVVDRGSDMVIKFNPAGRVTMVLGKREDPTSQHRFREGNEPAVPVESMFGQPTDVAFDSADNIYVSDGYVNSRIAKFDKNGKWIKAWGTKGIGEGQFGLPHNVQIDSRDNVYVADRQNGRIAVFDTDGKFLRQFVVAAPPAKPDARPTLGYQAPPPADAKLPTPLTYRPGAPVALCIPRGSNVIFTADLFPGRIYKLTLDGKLLGMLGEGGKAPKQFGGLHGIDCPTENLLYAAEYINWRSQKLVLHTDRAKTSQQE
jgi:hypothetical protein